MTKTEKYLLVLQLVLYTSLTIFSYAYVDLNLTFSTNPQVLKLITSLQQLGYYQRPTATNIYLSLLTFAFFIYFVNYSLFSRKIVSLKYLRLSIVSSLVAIFAYPFLSSDIFNYMFDAKIITLYGENPYTHKALDFPNDGWIRFMRWTHRTSPYGPLWLGFSIIPSVLGLGKFVSTLFAFKFFVAGFHIANSILIYKILSFVNKNQAVAGTALYALNPLIIIESLVNSHNDVVLATSLVLAIYFFIVGRKTGMIASIIAGTLVKYITILAIPAYLAIRKFSPVSYKKLVIVNFAIMATFTFVYSTFKINTPFVSSGSIQTQFQPWYLLWTLPYLALLPGRAAFLITLTISISSLLRYIPYISYGDWSQKGTVPFMQFLTISSLILTGIIILRSNAKSFFNKKN